MGSTVSTGKLAAAFKATSGKIMYVLFEETYESNCYPRTPRWNSYLIGELSAVLRHIFRCAACCEGGSLRGSGGRDISPEGYIGGWLKELENPVELSDRKFDLYAVDNYMAPIPLELFNRTKERMAAVGREADAELLGKGEHLIVSLYDDAELLAAIYDGIVAGASQIIKSHPAHAQRNPALGYSPAKSRVVTMATPQFMRVRAGQPHVAKQDSKGDWRSDSSHCFMSTFISNLWKEELTEPLTYRAKIKAYRDAIVGAQVMPGNAKLVVDTTVELESYQQHAIQWALENNSHTRIGTEIHFDLPTEFTQPTEYTKLYRVATISEKCAKFVFSDVATAAPTQQLDLLAG
jgi:hypothetical protein